MNKRRAYTLFELLAVLTVLVILSAVAYPSLEALYGDYKVTAAVDSVRAAWAQGRAQAANESQAYRFAVSYNGSGFRVAPDTSDYWAGDGSAPLPTDPTNRPLILEGNLPKGITFTQSNSEPANPTPGTAAMLPQNNASSGSWSTVVTFRPDGTASQDVEMVFRARGAKPRTLT